MFGVRSASVGPPRAAQPNVGSLQYRGKLCGRVGGEGREGRKGREGEKGKKNLITKPPHAGPKLNKYGKMYNSEKNGSPYIFHYFFSRAQYILCTEMKIAIFVDILYNAVPNIFSVIFRTGFIPP